MPMLERTNVRLDPAVVDYPLVCHRQVQTPDEGHLPTNNPRRMPFTGMFPRLDADVVTRNARLYGVTIPEPYTRYDTDFVHAHFGLMRLEGGSSFD